MINYTWSFDYENFPKGSALDEVAGSMLSEENIALTELFWQRFIGRFIGGSDPLGVPSFNYFTTKPSKQGRIEDLLGDIYGFGLIVSEKF